MFCKTCFFIIWKILLVLLGLTGRSKFGRVSYRSFESSRFLRYPILKEQQCGRPIGRNCFTVGDLLFEFSDVFMIVQ